MNMRKELTIAIIKNITIMYLLMVPLMAVGIGLKDQWLFDEYNLYYIFIDPLFFVLPYNVLQVFRLNYETEIIRKTNSNTNQICKYVKDKRLRKLYSIGNIDYYTIRSKFSLFRLKISVENNNEQVKVIAPSIIIKDMLNDLDFE